LSEGKWFVINDRGKEVRDSRGKSKTEATEAACTQLNMLHGGNRPWDYWQKQGYKLRRG
jgi:hypothetical protein